MTKIFRALPGSSAAALRLLLVVAVVVVVEPPSSARPAALPQLEDLNVLLIVIDTLGAEHLEPWNERIEHAPNIHRLAKTGVVFRRAYAPAPWTQPSVASLFTSQMPSRHGLIRIGTKLHEEQKTLAEELQERGFQTGAVVSHRLLDPRYGFDQGFESFDTGPVPASGHSAITSDKVTSAALKWITDRNRDAPFFMFVHYFDPHYIYRHHPEFDRTSDYDGPIRSGAKISRLRASRDELTEEDIRFLIGLYHEEIAYTDREIGRLLDHVEAHITSRPTLVVLTSDHGEEFMRHGWIGHTRTLYEELIRVPLVVSLPGILSPRRIDAPVSLVDVPATLFSMLSNPPDSRHQDGLALLPYLTGKGRKPERTEVFAEVSYETPGQADKTAFKTSLIGRDFKLIHDLPTDTFELYSVRSDPLELSPLADSQPVLPGLRERLLQWEETRAAGQSDTEDVPLDQEEIERLRSLGYVGGASGP